MSDLLPEGFVLDDAPAAPTGSALPDGFVLDDPAPATGTSELATDPGHIRANQVAAERAAKEPNLRNVPGPNGYSADNPPYKDGAYENRKQPPRPAQPEATWLTDLQSGWNNLMSGFAGTSLESGAKNEADTDRAIDAMKRAGTATPEQIAYLELRKKQIQQDQADAAQTLAIGAAKQAQLPPTPESVQRFNNATGWMDALSAFAADPYTISRSTILQSAPASIPSALGGIMGSILGPMGSSMGAGGGSYITELGGAVQEGLQRFGADMNDPASIMQVWSQHKAEISKYAQTRATVVGGADALTAGISSKFAGVNPVDQIIKGNIKRELLGIGIEAPGGMVGEAGAQLATEGRINQPGQVLAEGLGEVVPGAVQVAGSTVVQRALKGDRETASQQPPPQPQQPAPGKGDRIEPQMFPQSATTADTSAPADATSKTGRTVAEPWPNTGRTLADDEVLHGAGYTPEQIAEMHPAEKAQEAADARAQGVQPKPLPPAPGTAPLAPGFRPTAPVQQQEAPAAELQQSQQASSPQTEPPAGFVVDQPASAPLMPARDEVRAPFTPAPMAPRVQTALYPPSQADKAFSTFFASKTPITPEALAKASGMPQKDAVKAIQRAALRGSIIQTRQGKWMRAPTRVKPISAMQFIASIGGIQDPTGELAGMDLPKMGPYGPVIRKTGLHPDKVREALVEAGYLRDPGVEAGGQATTTVNDVYALLDNEMRGQKAYQPQDQARADALDTQAKNDALPPDYQPVHHIAQRFGMETWSKVKTALDTHGLDEGNWSTQELSDAARMVTEGQDPEDALVAAAIRFEEDANDPEAQFPEVQEWLQKRDPRAMLLFDHPPFPDVEPANAGQENADAESPGSAQPVSGGEGPGTQEAAQGPREEASVPRQDGSEGQGQQPAPAVEQGADNKPQTVLPGAEQTTPEQAKAAAAKDRARKELEIRQRQSKLRKGGQQSVEGQEGGMFAGEGPKQASMLDQPTDQSSNSETAPSKTPNRLVIQTGVVLRTKSGRETAPAPKIEATNNAKTRNTLNRMYQWLLDEARKEVAGDSWRTSLLAGINIKNLSQSDQDIINDMLFGDPDGATEENVVRVENGAKPKRDTTPQPKAEQKPAVKEQPAKIEDFGEKILGARKDAVRDIVKSLADEIDLKTEPLSKAFPQPDYVKLAEAGVDRKALALVALMRAEIPAKPRQSWKVDRWAAQVKVLRDFAQSLLSGERSADQIIKKIRDDAPLLNKIANTAEVLADIEPKLLQFASQFSIAKSQVSMLRGVKYDPAKTLYLLESDKRRWTDVDAESLDAIKEPALAYIRKKAEAELGPNGDGKARRTPLSIYQDRFTKDVFIGFKGVNGVIRLKTGFKTSKDARLHIKDHADELQKQIDDMREGPDLRRSSNMPRSGPARRDGDVSPQLFQETFGFRGVQFGNYVEGDRRQSDINEAFDALMDLSDVLGIPPQAISLGGKLGLAFGARGHGGKSAAAAHYEPGQIVINLTKHAGPGSLAHEWLHALDHHFARQSGNGGMISEGKNIGSLRPEMWAAWKTIQRTLRSSDLFKRSQELDKAKSKAYYATTVEMAARAFEKYIVDRLGEKQTNNDYLANIELSSGAYPLDKEMQEQGVRKAYDDLFAAMEVKWSDDRKQAVLSSTRKAPGFYSAILRAVANAKISKAPAEQWMNTIRNTPGVKQEEIEWIGLDEWLAKQKGNVTTEQVREFVQANQIEVNEVEIADASALPPMEEEEYQNLRSVWDAGDEMDPGFVDRMTELRDRRNGKPPRYATYQIPGGKNYRELLLTLPAKEPEPAGRIEELGNGKFLVDAPGGTRSLFDTREQAEAETRRLGRIFNKKNKDNFNSGHWDEPNVVAHVRFNERTVDGKKVLFVEEIQSDWHQAGRKKGYKDDASVAAAKTALRAYEKDLSRRAQEYVYNDAIRVGLSEETARKNANAMSWSSMEQQAQYLGEVDKYREFQFAADRAEDAAASSVPDAPFKTTWPELAMKRMIRWAAENGFDKIAWTPAEVQNERYSLAQHVDAVVYTPLGGNWFQLFVRPKGSWTYEPAGEHSAAQLPDQVGAAMADKIIKGKGRPAEKHPIFNSTSMVLDGLDLEIGGSGMKGFYDKMLVDLANRMGKKWGTRVKPMTFDTPEFTSIVDLGGFDDGGPETGVNDGREWAVIHPGTATIVDRYPTEQAAREAIEGLPTEYWVERRAATGKPITVHSIDVTQAMRDAAMQGQPLFRVPPNRYRYNISPQQEAEITADIQATAKRILGRHLVGVEVRRDLSKEFSAEEDAVYDPNTGLIWVALQGKQNPRTSIRHEAIHALRNAGVFTKQEWAALTRMAHGKWIEQYDIRARYERLYRERFDLTEAQIQELIVEEAIAEGYAEHVATERDDQSVAGRIFTRLRRFLEALRNMLAGRGFTSVDQIIRGVDEGQFGRRNAGAGQGSDFLLYAKQPQQDRLSSRGSNVQERLSAVPPDDGAPGRHPTGDPIREFAASAEAARRLEDLAGNINLRYIKAPEDVKQTLRDVADQAGGFINARRGKISHEQTARLAAELGMSERELLKRKQGQAFNAEQLFAARALLLQSSKRLTSLASRAKNSGSTADLAEFHKAFTRHAAIQEQIAGMTAEAGRALNQFKMLAGQDYFKQARNIMENAKSQKEFGTEAVKELAKMIDGMKDGVQIGRFTRTAFKTTTMDILRELWINALLSGPRTHATNILSNGLTALLQVPETAVAATISGLRGDRDGVRAGEAMARLVGLMEGAREGMQNARIAFWTGEPTDISSKLEYHNNNAIPGKLGTIVRTPSRALMAADELFKAINYRAEINAQAVRLAMREGVKGDLLARRIADYRNEPTMAMQDAAHEHALYQTFQNAMGPIAQRLMQLREQIPGAWLVLPFIRTPANIFKYAAERTPFGLAMREVRERMASGDAVVRDTQMARLALGGMIALGIASLAMAGLVSGGGPNDDDEKKIKRATGWQPYSFKIGDTWYSYQRLDPLGFQIGLIADLWETGGNLESAEADKIGAVIIKAIADGVLNKTYLSGLSEFTQAMNDPDRYADGYLRNFAGTLVPTGVAQIAQSFDPVYRDAHTALDKIKSRIPGLSQTLPARRDVFGEALTNEGSLGPDLISPIYATSEKDNPIAQAMIDADYFPGMPRRTIGKHELTPEQYDRYAEISGKRAVQLLQNRVTAPNWKGLGRDRQEKIIKKGFDDAREFARKKMMREFPELRKSAEPSTVE